MNEKQLVFSQDDLKPSFCNTINITTNESEFSMEFIYDSPNSIAVLLKRITLSPAHAKGLIEAMQKTLNEYEKQRGEVTAVEPSSRIGFDTTESKLK